MQTIMSGTPIATIMALVNLVMLNLMIMCVSCHQAIHETASGH